MLPHPRRLVRVYGFILFATLFNACAGKIKQAEAPESKPIPGTDQCVFYLPGPDTGSETGHMDVGATGTTPSASIGGSVSHNHGYYTYFGDCHRGPATPIGSVTPSDKTPAPGKTPASPVAMKNNQVSQQVKKVRQKAKAGKVDKARAGLVLLNAAQFYSDVALYADLKPANKETPPASTAIHDLRQEGNRLLLSGFNSRDNGQYAPVLVSRNFVVPEGELATDEEVHASATPEVSPTPKGEPTRQSILSDGDTILQKADALLKE